MAMWHAGFVPSVALYVRVFSLSHSVFTCCSFCSAAAIVLTVRFSAHQVILTVVAALWTFISRELLHCKYALRLFTKHWVSLFALACLFCAASHDLQSSVLLASIKSVMQTAQTHQLSQFLYFVCLAACRTASTITHCCTKTPDSHAFCAADQDMHHVISPSGRNTHDFCSFLFVHEGFCVL